MKGLEVVLHNQPLGIASAMHIHFHSAYYNEIDHPTELFGQEMLQDDLIMNPINYHDGKAEVPKGFMLEVKNKSSVAAKKQLLVGACVVDSGYDGEIFVNLHNTGKQTQWFKDGDKVAQGVLVPVNLCEIEEVSDPNELNKDSTRGEGALGSTGSR